jgi:hypothetical protein
MSNKKDSKGNSSSSVTRLTPEAQELFEIKTDLNNESDIILFPINMSKDLKQFIDTSLDEPLGKSIYWITMYHTLCNGLWVPEGCDLRHDDKDQRIPICSSNDGITGNNESICTTLRCSECDYNRFDTMNLIGKEGTGKACKNMMRLCGFYIDDINKIKSREGLLSIFTGTVYQITLPPTSIGSKKRNDDKYTFNTILLNRNKLPYALAVRELNITTLEGNGFNYCVMKPVKTIDTIIDILKENPDIANDYAKTRQCARFILENKELTFDEYAQSEEDIDPTVTHEGDVF